jgi:hypothetical protein
MLFWTCLLLAIALFAMVVLSPKLLAYWQLEKEHYDNQVKLVRLERQVEYLNKVASALETDAEFAKELARFEFDAFRPGDERIAVDRRLSLQAPQSPEPQFEPLAAASWFALPLRTFVDNRQNTNRALLTAAVLVVFAFAFLQESSRPATARSGRPDRRR